MEALGDDQVNHDPGADKAADQLPLHPAETLLKTSVLHQNTVPVKLNLSKKSSLDWYLLPKLFHWCSSKIGLCWVQPREVVEPLYKLLLQKSVLCDILGALEAVVTVPSGIWRDESLTSPVTLGRQPTTARPRQVRNRTEGCKQVEEGPGDDDAVVDVKEANHGHGGYADTWRVG